MQDLIIKVVIYKDCFFYLKLLLWQITPVLDVFNIPTKTGKWAKIDKRFIDTNTWEELKLYINRNVDSENENIIAFPKTTQKIVVIKFLCFEFHLPFYVKTSWYKKLKYRVI